MKTVTDINPLAETIADLYHNNRAEAGELIETFLAETLEGLGPEEKSDVLSELIQAFEPKKQIIQDTRMLENQVLTRVCCQLLGRDITKDDLEPEILLQNLSESLNTVFDALNELISVINQTLAGKQHPDETIRQVIGYHLEADDASNSLETHIGQIKTAFVTAYESFQETTHKQVRQIIQELGPETIKKEAGFGLNPIRGSRYFEAYELKFNKFINWVESGKFMEAYLREFERNCQEMSFK